MFCNSSMTTAPKFVAEPEPRNNYIEIKESYSPVVKKDDQWEEPKIRTFRSSIGLKFLSKKVRDIIKRKKFTNY